MMDKSVIVDSTRDLAGRIDHLIAMYVHGCLESDEMLKDDTKLKAFDMMSEIEQQLCFLADYIEKENV